MKIDFNKEIVGFDGTKVNKEGTQAKDDNGTLLFGKDGVMPVIIPSEEVATLADICKIALTRLTIKDQQLDGVKKFEFEQLAARIYKGGVHEVTAEEITLMKNRIGFIYAPLTVGACYRIFEAAENTKDEGKE